MKESAFIFMLIGLLYSNVSSFATPKFHNRPSLTTFNAKLDGDMEDETRGYVTRRKAIISTQIAASWFWTTATMKVNAIENAEDGVDNFESIAARAAKISSSVEVETKDKEDSPVPTTDFRTIYDFNLPVSGRTVPISELVGQDILPTSGGNGMTNEPKVKAILFVNIKQDDPVARRNIPEFITLASKFGRNGEFVIVCSPTDQGYYEPDTSQLIRMKLTSEYGYGINPATTITDKVNLLGTGAHPFWRWIEGSCRPPSGIGRIQGNFEKFLVDGRTGLPVRRYPRKYQPFDISNDIDAVMKGKPLPPAGANWKEEWRTSDKEAERDTYRFQKGLNVYDQ